MTSHGGRRPERTRQLPEYLLFVEILFLSALPLEGSLREHAARISQKASESLHQKMTDADLAGSIRICQMR
jgi:hypothetical protein